MANLLNFITPTNLTEQQGLFLAGKIVNPTFQYSWQTDSKLETISLNKQKQSLIEAVISQDREAINAQAKLNFEIDLTAEILQQAEIDSKDTPQKSVKTVAEFVESLQKALSFLDLDYEIILTESNGYNVRPQNLSQKIFCSKHLNPEFFSADGIIKHELTHIIRFKNGRKNGIKRMSNYLNAEEGIASFQQETYGENGGAARYQHAVEFLASRIAEQGSFAEVYEFFLSRNFSVTNAWSRAARHKFGYVDTAKPGDIWKPAIYYYHAREIEKLSELEQWKLLVGKVTIAGARAEPEYRGKWPLAKLQEFYQKSW